MSFSAKSKSLPPKTRHLGPHNFTAQLSARIAGAVSAQSHRRLSQTGEFRMRNITRSLLGLLAGAGFLTTLSISPAAALNLTLINGWTNAPFSTGNAAVKTVNGVVHFSGAIATTGTNPQPFVLPAQYAPSTEVYVKVDLCNAANGRLQIDPSGTVTVET